MISAICIGFSIWLLFPKSIPKVSRKKSELKPKHASLLFSLAIAIFIPSIPGIALAILVYLALPNLINRLPTRIQQRQKREAERELDLTIDLIAAALGAGLGVLSALDSVSKVVPPKLATELTAAANRIQWGAQIDQAFSSELSVIGSAVARAMDHGVGAGRALSEIAMRARSERKQNLLRRTKKLSVTLALPVALLMLPGFILIGIVPMIVPAITSLI